MKRFFTNKYPVRFAILNEGGDPSDIPIGTVFTIEGISGNMFEIKPVNKMSGYTAIYVDYQMLTNGFNETDFMDSEMIQNAKMGST